jgi:hypothetical protein
MASKREIKKQRKMLVMQTIKKIKKYQIPFDYKYGGVYFIFSFDGDEFNLHVTFRELPMMKFGIWKVNCYGDKPNYYFAECLPYIDKFKPSCCEFGWDSLESMMEWVSRCIKEPKFYISELERVYDESFIQILKDYADDLYRDSHHGFDQEEYEASLKAFNKLIAETNSRDYDIFWRKSDGFRNLYDVWFYVAEWVTDEQLEEFERKLRDCNCFLFEWRPLPPHFFKHKNQYHWKIHPGNKCLYFNQKKYYKEFNYPDKP